MNAYQIYRVSEVRQLFTSDGYTEVYNIDASRERKFNFKIRANCCISTISRQKTHDLAVPGSNPVTTY